MNIRSLLLFLLCCGLFTNLIAQNIPITPSENGTGVFLGETTPLRDIPELTPYEIQLLKAKAEAKMLNKKIRVRSYPFANVALPKGADAAWQKTKGKSPSGIESEVIFEGQSTSSYPPDCNGAAGPNHFLQAVNTTYAIYDKLGVKLAGPSQMGLLFNGVPGANCNDGDPIILYDEQADRWLACEFSLCDSTDRILMAVSTSNDPTGTWNAYSFDVADMPDYPKFSVWQDGYYMGDNNSSGNDIYVFERSKMIAGAQSPKFVGFNNSWRPGSVDGFMCVPPVDNDGDFAPAGSPGLFIAMSDDAFNNGTDQLWIYELAVNWSTTSASTFKRIQQLNVTPFDSDFGDDWTNIKQSGTTKELDAVPQVIMNVPQYRNFGTYQTIVCCHSVDVDKTDHAGIRWYELRKTPPSTSWVVRQQGTYAPDAYSRWMGSIMLNGNNQIGLGYSISGTALYPGIRYCGQTENEYNTASGILDFPENIIHNGTVSQAGSERWGDYSQMSVDPANDGTFWYSSQYVGSGVRKTKIASFQVGPVPPTCNFTANDTTPCLKITIVEFTSQATGNPTQYKWKITPTTFTFIDGSDSLSVNPKVVFNALGSYSVSLTVTNTIGATTTTKSDYIHVNEVNANFSSSSTLVVADNYITFNDASDCGANTWLWDFGANASPPTANTKGPHIVSYSTTGLKTISLIVNSVDTETKTGFINVIGSGINMSSQTVSVCNGTFYDPGGSLVNYSANKDFSMVFKPGSPGSKLRFNFTAFDVEEAFSTCNKDYLKIYDGNSELSPLIGTFCGTTSPGIVTATNDEGSILFVFHSNSTINKTGWTATIDCIGDPATNPASLTASAEGSTKILLDWTKNSDNEDVMLAWSADGIFGIPVKGNTYIIGDEIAGGGTILSKGNETTFNHAGLNPLTIYYYKAFSYNAELNYSTGITANDTTLITRTLSVNPQNINLESAGGSIPIAITSNSSWTVSSNQAWCTIPASGTGNLDITANYDKNLSVIAREATVTISVSDLPPVIVTLTQAGATPLLSISPSFVTVNAFAASEGFSVMSNTDWTASSDSAWCIVSKSGFGNGTVTVDFLWNPYTKDRSSVISVKAAGANTQSFTLTQKSLPEFGPKGLDIYPNPTKGLFNIVVDKQKYPEMQISIIGVNGIAVINRECKGESEYVFDLSKSPQGTYFVKIKTDTELLVSRLIYIK